jgi:hypothetical protein
MPNYKFMETVRAIHHWRQGTLPAEIGLIAFDQCDGTNCNRSFGNDCTPVARQCGHTFCHVRIEAAQGEAQERSPTTALKDLACPRSKCAFQDTNKKCYPFYANLKKPNIQLNAALEVYRSTNATSHSYPAVAAALPSSSDHQAQDTEAGSNATVISEVTFDDLQVQEELLESFLQNRDKKRPAASISKSAADSSGHTVAATDPSESGNQQEVIGLTAVADSDTDADLSNHEADDNGSDLQQALVLSEIEFDTIDPRLQHALRLTSPNGGCVDPEKTKMAKEMTTDEEDDDSHNSGDDKQNESGDCGEPEEENGADTKDCSGISSLDKSSKAVTGKVMPMPTGTNPRKKAVHGVQTLSMLFGLTCKTQLAPVKWP